MAAGMLHPAATVAVMVGTEAGRPLRPLTIHLDFGIVEFALVGPLRGGLPGALHLRLRRAHRTRPNDPAGRGDHPRLHARRCDVRGGVKGLDRRRATLTRPSSWPQSDSPRRERTATKLPPLRAWSAKDRAQVLVPSSGQGRS